MVINFTVGVLSLQGGFQEHLDLLHQAVARHDAKAQDVSPAEFTFIQVRTSEELSCCHALVIPGGESTTIAYVAAQTDLLEDLRHFVNVDKKPTWGTCAGLILLSAQANSNSTKIGGQELIGGLSVRVHRNHFGRQIESFETPLNLPFLPSQDDGTSPPNFPGIFIRAPVVEEVLSNDDDGTNVVEVLATLPGRIDRMKKGLSLASAKDQAGDIIAVRQGNVLGTSFHPELTKDSRIHSWFLTEMLLKKGL